MLLAACRRHNFLITCAEFDEVVARNTKRRYSSRPHRDAHPGQPGPQHHDRSTAGPGRVAAGALPRDGRAVGRDNTR